MSLSGLVVKYAWATPRSMPDAAPIYMRERYQSLFAAHDGCEAKLLACRAGDLRSWLPMLVRDMGGGVREAYSAYGYGGFFGDLTLEEADIDSLRRHLADEGIVALFLRHSPFLNNRRALPDSLSRLNRHTYAATLQAEESFSQLLARIPQKLRWSANFASRAGLKVHFHPLSDCPDEKILAFYREYVALMAAKDTSDYYHFSESFFLDHARRLGGDCELAEVVDGSGQFLGGAFFLLDQAGWVHYHLSTARREAMRLQGMELLMLSAFHRYGGRGHRSLHLGGGHSLDETDGLSRFKAKFASVKLDFHCTSLICDERTYLHERARLPLAYPSFFLISDARGVPLKPVNGRMEQPA